MVQIPIFYRTTKRKRVNRKKRESKKRRKIEQEKRKEEAEVEEVQKLATKYRFSANRYEFMFRYYSRIVIIAVR